ncbi:hypothetical protein MHM95_09935 [Pseudoalteromonas sp. CnMc7-15]|uniref:hypothetical protein n=2 Tax=unclassified Pseudoalteromonas TaxID=194690 RepID=UPI001EF46E72|nr:hypothetical protein [Pseudoalteromonas sp. CnMc7-15]MCG7566610.1 hypothetical protein [Pseudoalteromonas sp. CnMc7-15]
MNTFIKSCKVDYMRLTLDVRDEEHQELIRLNIEDLACRIANKTTAELTQILYPKAGYERFIRLPLFEEEFNHSGSNIETPHLVVKCSPSSSSRRFLTIELKGHKYSKSQWYCARLFLEHILTPELYLYYWDQLTVTNVHIALGSDIPLSKLLFDKLLSRKAGIYFNSDGDIELIYFQPKNRMQELAVYDRKAKEKNFGFKFQPDESTRAELRLGKLKTPLNKFISDHDYLNKFNSIKSYSLSKIKRNGCLGRYELMAIQAMGLTPFLRKHDKYERAKIRQAIKPYLVPVIKMNAIKSEWLKQVGSISTMVPLKKLSVRHTSKYKERFNHMYM